MIKMRFIVTVACAVSFAGCGGTSNESTKTTKAPASTKPQPTTTSTAASDPAAESKYETLMSNALGSTVKAVSLASTQPFGKTATVSGQRQIATSVANGLTAIEGLELPPRVVEGHRQLVASIKSLVVSLRALADANETRDFDAADKALGSLSSVLSAIKATAERLGMTING